ncbi:DUF3461 family protein [Aestuariirhabdus litorea]|uniref:DUF3461 family protein n=1 Tax=Aestuariirhabdus litorea TaxID=2528527 RepID=A0A3P3VNN4_9GAMM|nr:DUF3461 family protein [Aestuariirhabdus litorea]RRJ84034.1 DUF3461 family protein [Aestuariirhabdus litorea]RWW97255.1 DUF3461 family protein [Endozoicomonadaceae bacterium GTF-13]
MYEHLKSMGIKHYEQIERYLLRSEADFDILKVYYHKQKGDLFAKSEKFKFPRQKKTLMVDSGTHKFRNVTEISPALRQVVAELDKITQQETRSKDAKKEILHELKHLEKVVSNKIAELEARIENL